jgi:hypothetical protein
MNGSADALGGHVLRKLILMFRGRLRFPLGAHTVSAHIQTGRNSMARTFTITATMALLCLAISLPAGSAIAQQKQQVSIKIPGENIKFGLQQNVVVGDAPNHIVRVFETRATFPNNAPIINGLKLAEIWQGGIADIADGAGTTTSYFLYVMENGDKFVVRNANIIQPAGAGKLVATGVGHITGGTGKLGTIQGIARQVTTFDPIAGVPGDNQIEIEYSMAK